MASIDDRWTPDLVDLVVDFERDPRAERRLRAERAEELGMPTELAESMAIEPILDGGARGLLSAPLAGYESRFLCIVEGLWVLRPPEFEDPKFDAAWPAISDSARPGVLLQAWRSLIYPRQGRRDIGRRPAFPLFGVRWQVGVFGVVTYHPRWGVKPHLGYGAPGPRSPEELSRADTALTVFVQESLPSRAGRKELEQDVIREDFRRARAALLEVYDAEEIDRAAVAAQMHRTTSSVDKRLQKIGATIVDLRLGRI